MNWKLVLGLGIPFGLVMGVGVMLSWQRWLGWPVLIIALLTSSLIYARQGGSPFINGFFTGMYIGTLHYGLPIAFSGWLAEHSDKFDDFSNRYAAQDIGIPLIALMCVGVVLYAIVYGLLIGGLSWLLSKLIGPGRKAKPADLAGS